MRQMVSRAFDAIADACIAVLLWFILGREA